MNVDDFYDMLPREFWNKLDGFYELENLRQRVHWERTRWSTCLLLNVHVQKGKRIKPQDLILFDWEKKENETDYKDLKNKAELFKAKYNKIKTYK